MQSASLAGGRRMLEGECVRGIGVSGGTWDFDDRAALAAIGASSVRASCKSSLLSGDRPRSSE
jgi:uncharacterized protein GlcG (DUF336 family)